jgi:hypothetical protein
MVFTPKDENGEVGCKAELIPPYTIFITVAGVPQTACGTPVQFIWL